MSIDWEAWCERCQVGTHLGQCNVDRASFGFGADDESGRRAVAGFVGHHLGHGSLRVGMEMPAGVRWLEYSELEGLDPWPDEAGPPEAGPR